MLLDDVGHIELENILLQKGGGVWGLDGGVCGCEVASSRLGYGKKASGVNQLPELHTPPQSWVPPWDPLAYRGGKSWSYSHTSRPPARDRRGRHRQRPAHCHSQLSAKYHRDNLGFFFFFFFGVGGKPVGIRKPGAFKILILIKKSNGRTFAVQMGIQEECSVESTIGGQGHGKSRAHGLPVRIIRGELKWHSLDRSKNPPHCNVESG